MSKRTIFLFVFIFFCCCIIQAGYKVTTVDFLAQNKLSINAAGPLLVKTDAQRNRIILVNTNTSSISLIDGNDYSITNIPIKNRVPQYLKMEAMTIDNNTGNIYVIGSKSLHIILPDKHNAISIGTGEQYEMVAVNETNGDAFLSSRESKDLLMISFKTHAIKRIPWIDHVEQMINLNQTPPPAIRKIVVDNSLQQVIAVDGFTSTLHIFSATTGEMINKRELEVTAGARWHLAGYNQATHHLYLVIETRDRHVNEAIKINVVHGKDTVVKLPGFTEGVGVNYNPETDEVYIPYDNHPSVHVVGFKNNSAIEEIKIPNFGNDASVLDLKNKILYIASWGYGEVDVIDLKTRSLKKRIEDVGIIPHMFNMTLNPAKGELIIPIGASAVNGSFGASLTVLNPETEEMHRIYTGWAPVALVQIPGKDSFLVFNSEDQVAEVSPDGTTRLHTLPCWLINNAIESNDNFVYVSYGPHQTYWPTVYIWAAKNGIMSIHFDNDTGKMRFYDRRIPRMAHQMVLDKNGALYALQNSWGEEKQFLISLPDEIRIPNLHQMPMELEDSYQRETTPRLLIYDKDRHWLYTVRIAETDTEPSMFYIIDPESKKTLLKYPVGFTSTDLVFDNENVYVANFDSNTIAIIKKDDFSVQKIKTGNKPFKIALLNNTLYWINHNDNTLQSYETKKGIKTYLLPNPGIPSNIFSTSKELIITSHTPDALHIIQFNPAKSSFELIHKSAYPYGETTVDTNNSSFYMRGQFADGIFELNRFKQDRAGRIWLTDYLSGKLFILK